MTVSGVHVFQGWLAESMCVSPQVSLTEHLSTLSSAKQITGRTWLCGHSLREGPGSLCFPYVFKDSVVQPVWSPEDMVIQLFSMTL